MEYKNKFFKEIKTDAVFKCVNIIIDLILQLNRVAIILFYIFFLYSV